MQFSILINQERALAWGLNAQQAMLFAFLYEVPSWATPVDVQGEVFYHISKGKVIQELPLLTDKPDTVYRLMKQLQEKGVITITSSGPYTLMKISDQGKTWNQEGALPRKNIRGTRHAKSGGAGRRNIRGKQPLTERDLPRKNIRSKQTLTSEKNPAYPGEKSDLTSDKSPTDQLTSNQITRSEPYGSPAGNQNTYPPAFTEAWEAYPKRVGANPKRRAFQAWNARIKSGADPRTVLAGVERYHRFALLTGKLNTEFVMQASRFFGPDEHYLNDWHPPRETTHENRSGNRPTGGVAERIARANRPADTGGRTFDG